FVGGVSAADIKSNGKKDNQRAAAPKLVTVTYPVADLIVPVDMDLCAHSCEPQGGPQRRGPQTLEDTLMQTITKAIARDSWKDVGGQGTMQYFPLGMALVVTQTEAVQQEVFALLKALRRLQDLEISFQVMIAEVPDYALDRFRSEQGIDIRAASGN